MKKTISIFFAVLLSVGLVACGGSKKEASKANTATKQEVKKEDSKNNIIQNCHIDALESDKSYEEMTSSEKNAAYEITTDYWNYLSDEQKEKYKDRKEFIKKTRQEALSKKSKEEESKKLEEETKKSSANNLVTKDSLKFEVENLISNDLKGKLYSLDILTPTQEPEKGFIISVQFDNKFLSDEESCKNCATQFINKIKDVDGIKSLDMNFISDYNLKYYATVDDFNNIKSNSSDSIQINTY